jgi:single-stranded-DNA-specific exonuclease
MPGTRWNILKHNREQVAKLARETSVSPIIAALLISRGHFEAEAAHKFLNPSFDQIHQPTLLTGLKEAVTRIFQAVERNEKILVWGDYDVDGTTGTVVLRKALELIGANTGFHVPHRFTEGYGINIPALEKAKAEGYSLVISVDCGITSFEPLLWATENGLDVIVTDHHLPKEHALPPALAVVNPNQKGCQYPDKNLAGVGVAFKLAHQLLREKGKESLVKSFLKVVAIGTIADIMQLTGENRAIVALGLKDLPQAKNYGLRALMEVAACTREMTAYDVGFRIAPRLNAAGRMDAAGAVVELLETDDFEKARILADHLDRRNRERQEMQKQIVQLVFEEFMSGGGRRTSPHFAVVAGNGWHRGVIGLAAAKISEKLHRPAIVISLENGVGVGSARSIKPYHLLNGLDSCTELMEKHGGHAQAAGMTIKAENIEILRQKLNQHALSVLSEDDLIPEIHIDAILTSQNLSLDLVQELKQLEPFGAGNPKPTFMTRNLILSSEPLIMKEKHLKLRLTDAGKKSFEAVWWNGVEEADGLHLRPNTQFDVAYTPETNTWNGNTRLQLVVKDLRASRIN